VFGHALKGVAVDEGISQEGSPAPFIAIGYLMFDSLKASESALNTHGARLMADIPNYTNTKPTIQVSEIRM